MKEPTIYEHAHLAFLATLGWRIDKAEYQSAQPIEFYHRDKEDGTGEFSGTANSWKEAINKIMEVEGIEA